MGINPFRELLWAVENNICYGPGDTKTKELFMKRYVKIKFRGPTGIKGSRWIVSPSWGGKKRRIIPRDYAFDPWQDARRIAAEFLDVDVKDVEGIEDGDVLYFFEK